MGWAQPQELQPPKESSELVQSEIYLQYSKYRDNHIHKDVAEIILHFIIVEYRNMLTNKKGNKPARPMVAYL